MARYAKRCGKCFRPFPHRRGEGAKWLPYYGTRRPVCVLCADAKREAIDLPTMRDADPVVPCFFPFGVVSRRRRFAAIREAA